MGIQPGQSLGPYRILEPLGRGGMATVYRASQPSLSRQVAIKVLPEFFAQDPAFHERFRQEAMAIAKLRHPNILTVFDSGESDGVAYIVTELLEGGTLATKLGKPLPVDEVIALTRPIAAALDYAHARGMVHRDVKPANILMAEDGTPILSDFGLARMTNDGSDAMTRLTTTGMALGTPEYMAPEQIRGRQVGPQADVYALAVMLYEMVTGVVPHTGDTPIALMMARLNDALPPPRERNPNVSLAVQEVLMKGLAQDPSQRYASAGEMIRALEAASRATTEPEPTAVAETVAMTRASGTIQATPSPSATAVVASSPRGRPVGVIAAGVVALVVLIGAGVMWSQHGATPAPASTPASTQPTSSANGDNSQSLASPTTTPTPVVTSASTPTPAAKVTASPDAAAAKRASADGLPPRGLLRYSMTKDAARFVAMPLAHAEDSIAEKGGGLEFTAGSETGLFVSLPVQNIADFVAVLRYTAVDRRPGLNFYFHANAQGESHAVRLQTNQHLSPAAAGARAEGPHACCLPFDVFRAPQKPEALSLFSGTQPMSIPASPGEEEVITVAATGPLIVVSSGAQEIARVSDGSFGAGGMKLGVTGPRGQASAVLRINALDVYDPPNATGRAAASTPASGKLELPPHGKLLYDMAADVSNIAASRQQHPEDTIVASGTSLEFTAGSTASANMSIPVSGVGDFVAVLRFAAVSKEPILYLRFHQTAQPGGHVVQIPSSLKLIPPQPGAPPSGPHPCCGEFDIYVAPLAGGASLITGPLAGSVASAANEEHVVVVSVKGPAIVVYEDGREIARVSDSSFGPGRISLQVVARRQQTPAVLRLTALQIYEAK